MSSQALDEPSIRLNRSARSLFRRDLTARRAVLFMVAG